MFILLFMCSLLAAPVDRNDIFVEIQTATKPLTLTAFDPNKINPIVSIKQGRDDFTCFTTRRVHNQRLEKIASLLDEMVAGVDAHPNADWGKAHEGITGSLSQSWCNASASTRSGYIMLTFSWNRFCAGSHCNTEFMTVGFTKAQAIEAAEKIRILNSYITK